MERTIVIRAKKTIAVLMVTATAFTATAAATLIPGMAVEAQAAFNQNARTADFEFSFSIPSDWRDITDDYTQAQGIKGVAIYRVGEKGTVEFLSINKSGVDFSAETLSQLLSTSVSGSGLTITTEPYVTDWGTVAGRDAYYGTAYVSELGQTVNAYLLNGKNTILFVYQISLDGSGVTEWANVVSGGKFVGSRSQSGNNSSSSGNTNKPSVKKKKTKAVSKKGAKSINSIISLAKKHRSLKGKKVYGKVVNKDAGAGWIMIQDPNTYYTITIYTSRASSIKTGKKYAFKITKLTKHSSAYMDITVKGY